MTGQDVVAADAEGLIPQADAARQAIASLRGYAYQVTAAALEWLDLDGNGRIYLEVAEDYAVVAKNAIDAVQVKDTRASGSVTLNTQSVRDAIQNFVALTASNQGVDVQLRYFTTSDIGTERAWHDRLSDTPGLLYWRRAAKGADVKPLRDLLDSDKFGSAVREFVRSRDDEELRRDLLRKVHWECGRPELVSLRKEFQDRLIVIGRDTFRIPSPDVLRISNLLVHHVLEKSVCEHPADRALSRADLLQFIDGASRVSVPLSMVDMLAQVSSGAFAQMLAGSGSALPVALGLPVWLVDGSDLPPNKRAVPRPRVEEDIERRLREFGVCFVAGPSGVGKSSVARAVATKVGSNFFIVDFRNANFEETRNRLTSLLSRIGGLHGNAVILEDLNQLNDPSLGDVAVRVFEALSRRDIAVVVTSYGLPTPKTLSNLGQDAGSTFDCPYFTEQESSSLVELHSGDASLWGKLAHVSGANGHPQLVHAFIAGVASRGWPRSEIPEIISAGLSTGDIAAEREAARRMLISVLPENARNLLYRLSLMIGTFNRVDALSISGVPPPVLQAGEALDSLIGPWIETTGRDSYRVSPLASQSGREMLVEDQQRAIHHGIASQLMSKGTIDAGDIDKIALHAIFGKNEPVLVSLTSKLLVSGDRVINFLSESSSILRVLNTDKPIYPENEYISLMLRLVQCTIIVAAQEKEGVASCVRALFEETERLDHAEARDMFQVLSLGKVLGTLGIANYLDNWVELLLIFQKVANGQEYTRKLFADLEAKETMPVTTAGVLFAIGSSNLISVQKLESVLLQLDKIEPEQRSMLLRPIDESVSDYAVLINSPWVTEQNNNLEPRDAAECYRRMAALTANWGMHALTLQCWIARAVMLDEYASDSDGALRVLDEAVIKNGDDVLIARARAKIYWRAHDHKRALSILREIADEIGKNNNVERAFALREAAISAASCDDWSLAEQWFLEAKASASKARLPDMRAMAVGLGADAAVAAFEAGDIEKCLRGLGDALTELGGIDPQSSLRCAHCHHLVRHSVLWIRSRVEGKEVRLDGEPLTMRPGICSNPEPAKAIAEKPLGHVDITWYILAEAELMGRVNVGILDGLYSRLSGGPIAVLETSLRTKRLGVDIANLDVLGFTCHLSGHIEAIAHLLGLTQEFRQEFDLLNPTRSALATIDPVDIPRNYRQFADDAVLAFVIVCACRQGRDALAELESALDARFGPGVVGAALFARINLAREHRRPSPVSFEEALIDHAMAFCGDAYLSPQACCAAGVRFLQQAQRSTLREFVVPAIAKWQRSAWGRIVASEGFQLTRPLRSIPAIGRVLSLATDDVRFLSALLLEAAEGTGVALPPELHDELRTLAGREVTDGT